MKKNLFGAALFAVCSLGTAIDGYAYEIKGKIVDADFNGKYVYVVPYGVRDAKMDSAQISNNSFMFKGADSTPAVYAIYIADKMSPRGASTPYATTFVGGMGKMEAVLDNSFSYVAGTPENNQYKDILQFINSETKKINELVKSAQGDKAAQEVAYKKADEMSNTMNAKVIDYINSNLDKVSAGKLLFDLRYEISESEQEKILAKASSSLKSFPGIATMEEHLNVLKNVAPGKKFIDFEMADADGKMHKLSEYIGKGKVVLLDFWASWCGPCMREVPNIKKVYEQYKDKGFEIVGVSFDNKKANWMKARTDKNMNWIHLSDLKGWKSLAAPMYGVNSIPCTFLIDKDGTILQRNILGEELETKLSEILK